MNVKRISWIEGNYDLEFDSESVLVEQGWGNKGLGGIVFGLCGLAVLFPIVPTIMQIAKGTAKGNPIGALIALFVVFSWPLYWGLNQFFLKRHLMIIDDSVKFELISLLGTKKYEIKIEDYGQIEFGRTKSIARTESGAGMTARYFVRLPHKDRNCEVVFYENVRKLMSEERMQRYSEKLNLPLVNVTPDEIE